MTQGGSDYARSYSAMADEALLALAHESATPVDSALTALRGELDSRGLKPEPEPAKESRGDTDSGFYCVNCARQVVDPLIRGDCSAVICRVCGAPLKTSEDLDPEDLETKA